MLRWPTCVALFAVAASWTSSHSAEATKWPWASSSAAAATPASAATVPGLSKAFHWLSPSAAASTDAAASRRQNPFRRLGRGGASSADGASPQSLLLLAGVGPEASSDSEDAPRELLARRRGEFADNDDYMGAFTASESAAVNAGGVVR
eukprot:TRINITY_DN40359_c0_g1_i1.p1 TRINITY_DN40359_c0_g1~~TRINITY_DN40359_c0_g1_i1.p1  ORF type:complete len:149 (-),score=35.49 TRINITY_DN40359_c0_g1_i1:97-543(-)